MLFEWIGVASVGLGYLYLTRRVGTLMRLRELYKPENLESLQKAILVVTVVSMITLFFRPPGHGGVRRFVDGHDWVWNQHEVFVGLLLFEWIVLTGLCTYLLYLTGSKSDESS